MEKNKDKPPVDIVTEAFEKELKKNYIKNMVQGYEIAMKMIVDFCDRGDRSVEDIKAFCEGCLKPQNKTKFVKIATKERK